MKPIYAAFLWVLPLSSVFAHTGNRYSEKAIRAQIVANYARMNAAMRQPNSTLFISVLRDVTAPGKMRNVMLSGAEATAKAGGDVDLIKTNTLRTTILSLTVHGSTAIVTAEQYGDVIRRDSQGQYGPVGQDHHIIGKTLFRDTWQRIGKSWKLANEIGLDNTAQVDGKSISNGGASQ